MIRIAHLADLHIGANGAGYTAGAAASAAPDARSYRDVAALFDRVLAGPTVGDGARSCGAVGRGTYDAVLIAGDVFDRAHGEKRGEELFLGFLSALAAQGTRVAIIAGNHDAENGVLWQLDLPAETSLLGRARPETVTWPHLGVAVHGQSISVADEQQDLSAAYPTPVPALLNIGMLHTSLDGRDSARTCAPTTLTALEGFGYDYWALGHVHARAVLGSGRVAYAGGASSRRTEEDVPRGFLEIEFSSNHPEVTAIDAVLVG